MEPTLTDMQGGPEDRKARASLYAKMAKVLTGVTRLPKTGYNQRFDYMYATESDVTDMVRKLLAEVGLCMFVSMEDATITPTKTSRGNDTNHVVVALQVSICDGDSGVCWISEWRGEARDTQDKGITKAVTSALKYFLLKTFLISTGDRTEDPDGSWGDDEPGSQPKQRQSSPSQRKPANGNGKKPTTSNRTQTAIGPTEFYKIAKSAKYFGPGKKFENEAALQAYMQTFKAGNGYNWAKALTSLGKPQ